MRKPLLVESIEDIQQNIERVEGYLCEDSLADDFAEMANYIAKGRNLICYLVGKEYHFVPSRFIGYKQNSLSKHLENREKRCVTGITKDGTTAKLSSILGPLVIDDELDKKFIDYCNTLGYTANKHKHSFWCFPERFAYEVSENVLYEEGGVKTKLHKIRERNRAAREMCIRAKGTKCSVCGFDFKAVYGEIGKGYIQVHHLKQLSSTRGIRITDPIKELAPVCPNCHAMLHRGKNGKMLTIEELKALVKQSK